MPARAASSKAAKSTAATSSSKAKSFSFKSMRRDSSNGAPKSFSSAKAPRRDKPTSGRARRTKYQSGDNEGEYTNNWVYAFDPAYGLNDDAKEAVKKHVLGSHEISSFKKELGGFTVRVYSPQQVHDMHEALREVDSNMDAAVELDGLEAPELTVVTVTNLDLPATSNHPDEQEGVTALMLDGFSYPLYRHLRKLGYDFYRGVHGNDGINRWCRVVQSTSEATKAEKETVAALKECGWAVDTAAGDANDWEEDE